MVLNQRFVPLYKTVPSLVRANPTDPSFCNVKANSEFTDDEVELIVNTALRHAAVFRNAGEQGSVWVANIVEQVSSLFLRFRQNWGRGA